MFYLQPTTNNQQPKNGFAVLYAVLTASLLLAVGLAIFNISLKNLKLSSQIRNSQLAIFAADAGLECSLFWDLQHPNYPGSVFGGFTSSDTLSDGLVGYWALNETSGTNATDSSVSGNNGTLQNMDDTDWVAGKIGNALNFDGVDDSVQIFDDPTLDVTGGITIAFWIYQRAPSTAGGNAVTKNDAYKLGPESTNDYRLMLETDVGGWGSQKLVSKAKPSTYANSWVHIAGTYNTVGTISKIYINGVEDVTSITAIQGNLEDLQNLNLQLGKGGAPFLNGKLDEVRIYNRALTPDEVQVLSDQGQVFSNPVPQNTPGINCTGENITDPTSGWDTNGVTDTGRDWYIFNYGANHWAVGFDLQLKGELCSTVVVDKNNGVTKIESRGYNTCDSSNPYRVERALRATY